MRDDRTGTVWNHLDGKATEGPLTGARLDIIPIQQTTWEAWLSEYPNTTVLAFDTPYQANYQLVPIGELAADEAQFGDDRLPSNTLVLGVEVDGLYRGYTLTDIKLAGGALNHEFGGEPIVAAYDFKTGNAMAYNRQVLGAELQFKLLYSGGRALLEDLGSGSRWTIGGQPVSGPLATVPLRFIPSIISEWYGWSGYHSETELYDATG